MGKRSKGLCKIDVMGLVRARSNSFGHSGDRSMAGMMQGYICVLRLQVRVWLPGLLDFLGTAKETHSRRLTKLARRMSSVKATGPCD